MQYSLCKEKIVLALNDPQSFDMLQITSQSISECVYLLEVENPCCRHLFRHIFCFFSVRSVQLYFYVVTMLSGTWMHFLAV